MLFCWVACVCVMHLMQWQQEQVCVIVDGAGVYCFRPMTSYSSWGNFASCVGSHVKTTSILNSFFYHVGLSCWHLFNSPLHFPEQMVRSSLGEAQMPVTGLSREKTGSFLLWRCVFHLLGLPQYLSCFCWRFLACSCRIAHHLLYYPFIVLKWTLHALKSKMRG